MAHRARRKNRPSSPRTCRSAVAVHHADALRPLEDSKPSTVARQPTPRAQISWPSLHMRRGARPEGSKSRVAEVKTDAIDRTKQSSPTEIDPSMPRPYVRARRSTRGNTRACARASIPCAPPRESRAGVLSRIWPGMLLSSRRSRLPRARLRACPRVVLPSPLPTARVVSGFRNRRQRSVSSSWLPTMRLLSQSSVGLGQSLDDRRRAAVQEDDRHLPLRALATPLRQSQ